MNEEQKNKKMNMSEALTRRGKDPGFWREIWQQARLVYYLIRDPEVPFYLKLLPFAALVYLISPIDFISDLAPVLGQLDDLTALIVTSKVFVELSPPAVVARHLHAIRVRDGFAAPDVGETAVSDTDIADAIIIEGEHEPVVENGQQTD